MDEVSKKCPLCSEELDLTEKNFRPCPCGTQVNSDFFSINSISKLRKFVKLFAKKFVLIKTGLSLLF